MVSQDIATAVTDLLLAAREKGCGIYVKPEAPFTTLEFFLAYAHEITNILKKRGVPGHLMYHANLISISDVVLIPIGNQRFSADRNYSETEIRRALTDTYREEHGIETEQPLPDGAEQVIEAELEAFMQKLTAARAEDSRDKET